MALNKHLFIHGGDGGSKDGSGRVTGTVTPRWEDPVDSREKTGGVNTVEVEEVVGVIPVEMEEVVGMILVKEEVVGVILV